MNLTLPPNAQASAANTSNFRSESLPQKSAVPYICLPFDPEGLAKIWSEAQKYKDEVGGFIHGQCERAVSAIRKNQNYLSFLTAINLHSAIDQVTGMIQRSNLCAENHAAVKANFTAHQILAKKLQSILSLAIDQTTAPFRVQIKAGDYSIFSDLKREALSSADTFTSMSKAREAFVKTLLGYKEYDIATEALEIGMYGFEPTSTDISIRVLGALNIGEADKLCDLGSGNGKIVHLCNLCTPGQATGIEFQKALHHEAESISLNFNLDRTNFIHADVRKVDFGDANIFYIFNAFSEVIMRDVLKKIQGQAKLLQRSSMQNKRFLVAAWSRTASVIEHNAPWLKQLELVDGVSIFQA